MSIYLLKSFIEIIALVILFIISERLDKRITFLENENSFGKTIKELEQSFSQKKAQEEKRINKIDTKKLAAISKKTIYYKEEKKLPTKKSKK